MILGNFTIGGQTATLTGLGLTAANIAFAGDVNLSGGNSAYIAR